MHGTIQDLYKDDAWQPWFVADCHLDDARKWEITNEQLRPLATEFVVRGLTRIELNPIGIGWCDPIWIDFKSNQPMRLMKYFFKPVDTRKSLPHFFNSIYARREGACRRPCFIGKYPVKLRIIAETQIKLYHSNGRIARWFPLWSASPWVRLCGAVFSTQFLGLSARSRAAHEFVTVKF